MKPNIDAHLVASLIESQFPEWAELPIEPVKESGWDNKTFRLGSEMSVRLPSAERYAAQVDKEHRWLPFLAAGLPLAIPHPIAKGKPSEDYSWPWSVYRWLPGESLSSISPANKRDIAIELATFLTALQQIDAADGPVFGQHNFFRGGPLRVYDEETRQAIRQLEGQIDSGLATAVWEAAMAAPWSGPPVWIHGDVSAGNILAVDGALSAVIDFGCCGVGDPACDLTIAWTYFDADSREAFSAAVPATADMWARARGWALWKALITAVGGDPGGLRVANEVMAEYRLR